MGDQKVNCEMAGPYLVVNLVYKTAKDEIKSANLVVPMMKLEKEDNFCALNRFTLLQELTDKDYSGPG